MKINGDLYIVNFFNIFNNNKNEIHFINRCHGSSWQRLCRGIQ
jgi:hypothetical protein